MVDAFLETTMLETTMHPNGKSHGRYNIENNNVETIVHSNGKCTIGNNNGGNNSACLNMTHI
jgi:hypothetical protein